MAQASASPRPRKYWVYDWLDANSVTSTEQARALLLEPGRAVKTLAESVEDLIADPVARASSYEVVAGRGADLSGELDCMNHECQLRQVDEVLRRALFYFDTVEVAGLNPHAFSDHDRHRTETDVDNFVEHIWVLLDLRKRHLDDLLIFTGKPEVGEDYLREAAAIGMVDFNVVVQESVAQLAKEALISIERHGDHGHYQLSHPALEHAVWGHIHPRRGFRLGRRDAARDVVGKYARALVSDVMAARSRDVALTSRWIVHERWLTSSMREPARVEDVFLDLELPVPNTLTADQFRAFRQENADSFVKFRHALATGIRERLGSANQDVAREVVRDVVEPSLSDIRLRIDAAETSLSRKVLLGGASSAVVASIGLLIAAPLLAPIAAATAIPIYTGVQKYLDERADLQLNDMFFLWRAGGHTHQT